MEGIFFIDIETVPGIGPKNISTELPQSYMDRATRNETLAFGEVVEKYMKEAALFAEWGKIVSVSVGTLYKGQFIVKTICSLREIDILLALGKSLSMGCTTLGGHNIREFDCPYLMRRYLANGMIVPKILNTMGKKPWEIQYEDTLDMWSGSQWKHKVSLSLLCEVLGVPSPKGNIGGADVARLYYSIFDEPDMPKEKEICDRIAKYNAGDVVGTARCYAKMKGFAEIKDSQLNFLSL